MFSPSYSNSTVGKHFSMISDTASSKAVMRRNKNACKSIPKYYAHSIIVHCSVNKQDSLMTKYEYFLSSTRYHTFNKLSKISPSAQAYYQDSYFWGDENKYNTLKHALTFFWHSDIGVSVICAVML